MAEHEPDSGRPELSLERLVEELRVWDKDLAPYRDMWAELDRAWRPSPPGTTRPDDPKNPFISKVRVPWCFKAVETVAPRVVGAEPRMDYRAIDDNDDSPVAAIMGGLSSWQMERMGFELEMRTFLRQGLKRGYTVGILGWVREELDVPLRTPVTAYDQLLGTTLTTQQQSVQRVALRNDPFFETIDLNDFVWPLLARSLDAAKAVWHRRWVTLEYLHERDDVYSNLDDVRGDAADRLKDSRRGRYEDRGIEITTPAHEQNSEDEEGIVELWSRWTDDYLCALANPFHSPVKIRGEPTPFQHKRKPFVDWTPTPEDFEMHGIGVVQTIYDLNEDLNTMRRQRRDAITYTLNPAWKRRGGGNQNQLEIFPGKVFDLDETEDLEPATQPHVDFAGSYREEEEIKRDMEEASGAFNFLAGQTQAGEQTATEVATLTSEGNKRIAEMIELFAERTMKRFGHLLAQMNIQYIDTETAIDFSDDPEAVLAWEALARLHELLDEDESVPEGVALLPVTPEMIRARGRLDPVPKVGQDKVLNEIQRRSDAAQALQALAPLLSLPMAPLLFNYREIAAWVLEEFSVPKMARQRILQASPEQLQAMVLAATAENIGKNGDESGESGESGDNRPEGGVVGAPGVAGPIGPPQ